MIWLIEVSTFDHVKNGFPDVVALQQRNPSGGPHGDPFSVTKRDDGAGVQRLIIAGELDEDTGDGCAELIANAAGRHDVSEVVVDLRRVTFVAAAGVRALLRGRDASLRMGREFRVVNATGIVYQVLRISGVHKALAVTSGPDVPTV
ncbi:STAS domain-containing protein [Actinoplanes sp. NPDC023801]|uniref:STAS domain-containing protein n=1 Tax=Actinoplanes sp. NPDC023801 TaxID=3154595 RepID=UPI0033D305A4